MKNPSPNLVLCISSVINPITYFVCKNEDCSSTTTLAVATARDANFRGITCGRQLREEFLNTRKYG